MLEYENKTTTGTSESSYNSYVLGKHTWTIEGDSHECSKGKPYTRALKLTGCEEGEFTCSDGQCVAMHYRCDQVVQCRDQSDEEKCEILAIKKSYNRKVPPITTVSSTNFTVVAVEGEQSQIPQP